MANLGVQLRSVVALPRKIPQASGRSGAASRLVATADRGAGNLQRVLRPLVLRHINLRIWNATAVECDATACLSPICFRSRCSPRGSRSLSGGQDGAEGTWCPPLWKGAAGHESHSLHVRMARESSMRPIGPGDFRSRRAICASQQCLAGRCILIASTTR